MRKFIYTNEFGKSIEFTKKSGFRITNIDGLSSNNVSFDEVTGDIQVGNTVTSQKVESKSITIEGDYKESYKNRRTLLDIIIPGSKGTLQMIDDINDVDVYIDCFPKTTPYLSEDKVYQKFQFQLYAPYPYWKSKTKTIHNFFVYKSLFRLPRSFSSTVPWKISSRDVLSIINAINNGTVKTGFNVTFKSLNVVKAPKLINVNTQKVIKFKDDTTLNIGEKLMVSTFEDNILVIKTDAEGVETNAFDLLDIDVTDFWQLLPGDNIVKYDAASGSEYLDVTIDFDEILVGV